MVNGEAMNVMGKFVMVGKQVDKGVDKEIKGSNLYY